MLNPAKHLILALILVATAGHAQQSPSPQPSQTQTTPAPCAPVASPTNATNTGPLIKPTAKTQQALDGWRKKLSAKVGIDIPDPTQLPIPKKTLPPCQPAKPDAQLALAPKPPADASVTLRCNPLITPAKGVPGAMSGFILPDPHQYETPPQTNIFEADSAMPDVNAKTPCYALKVDPKTNKYFIAQ